MKHKLNSKSQDGTTADACKIAENLKSSQPIANAYVARRALIFGQAMIKSNFNLKK